MRNTSYRNQLFVLLILTLFCSPTFGQKLALSSVFTDHMVLQRDKVLPVWGKSGPDEQIIVTFAGQKKTTRSTSDGNWMVKLEPLSGSKVGRDLVVLGNSKVVISDVVVGEVWICSGQSNMQFAASAVTEIRGLTPFSENVRSFEVKRTVSLTEKDAVSGQWEIANPSSAVAFSFAYFLQNSLDVPVGIIHSSWGSSSIEAWMPKDMTEKLPHFKTIMAEFDADTATQNRIHRILKTPNGWTGQDDIFLRRQPNVLYNAMMKPLAPFACQGIVWYQGERNTRYLSGMPQVNQENWYERVAGMKEYGDVLSQWIVRYRQEWHDDEMNLLVVMLPGYGKGTMKKPDIDPESPTEESWAWMRESQLKVLDVPHTAVANTIDLGDLTNIHPKDKLPIGQRLALLAAKSAIGSDRLTTGPILKNIEIRGGELIVKFENATGLKTLDHKAPTAFWIADNSGQWKPAVAKLIGENVILSSPEIAKPLYVRYAFSGKPKVNLVNSLELPAYPFRTDDFEQ